MTTQTEALKLALEALEKHGDAYLGHSDEYQFAITKVKEALAQPEQEPVVGTKTWFEDGKVVTQYLHTSDIYTTPPQRKPLTDEIKDAFFEGFTSVETYNDKRINTVDEAWEQYKAAHGIKGDA